MNKRVLKVLACLFTVSVFLSACSTQSEPPVSSTASSGENSSSVGEGNTYEPKTVKVMGSVDTAMWDTRDNQPVYAELQKMFAAVNLTVEVEAVAQEQYEQVLKTRTATALDLPDLVNLNAMDNSTAIALGKAGVFQNVKPLVEQYDNGNIAKLQEDYLPSFWGPVELEDGSAYWFPMYYKITYDQTKAFSSVLVPLIRQDWLDKVGLKKPTTAEEFVAAMEAFRSKDANENGKADEVLLYTPGFSYFGPLFGLPADHMAVDVSDDIVKSPWLMKDQLIPYVQFLRTLVEKGILDTDSLDKPAEYTTQKIKSNVVGCQTGYGCTNFYSDAVKDYNGSYEGIVFKGGTGEQYVQGELPEFVQGKMAITKSCTDTEAAVRYLDVFSTPEYAVLHRYGIEGDGHTMEDGVLVPSDKLNVRDWDLQGHAVGHTLWGGLYGSLAFEQWETLRIPFKNNAQVLDMGNNHSCGNHKYYYSNQYPLAVQNDQEFEDETQYMTDLQTYMNETITKLALGQYSIEDIDTYIAKMKDLGLETMMKDYQARHDRFIGK